MSGHPCPQCGEEMWVYNDREDLQEELGLDYDEIDDLEDVTYMYECEGCGINYGHGPCWDEERGEIMSPFDYEDEGNDPRASQTT